VPIYEFSCLECGKDFESLMKPHDPIECPSCKTRVSYAVEGGSIVKKLSVTSKHVWGCSPDGAMPKRGK
jgi:putative FmdB family regulatory protein